MKRLIFGAIAVVAIAAVAAGCGDLVPGTGADQPRMVTVTVARLNPALFKTRVDRDSDSRAFAWADSVLLTVYAKGTLEDMYVDSVTIPVGSMSTATVATSFTLSPGTYRLVAYIYNNKNSTELPVVSGEKTFNLPGGSAAPFPVTVVCVPTAPLAYAVDMWGTSLWLPAAWYASFGTGGEVILETDESGNPLYGHEGWNSFVATTTRSRIQVRPIPCNGYNSVAAPYVALFDGDGEFLGESIPSRSRPGWEAGVEAETVSGETYYFVVLDLRGNDLADANQLQYMAGVRSHSPYVGSAVIAGWPENGVIAASPLPISVTTLDSAADQTECWVRLVSRDFAGAEKLIQLTPGEQLGTSRPFAGSIDFSGITDPNSVGYILQVFVKDTASDATSYFGFGGAWEIPFTVNYSEIEVTVH